LILLDTHAWVRWLHPELGQPLPPALRNWLESGDEPLAISVISCLEVSQLVKKQILVLPLPLPQWFEAALEESAVLCLPLTPKLLHDSTLLPDIHRDPADRIIIATALEQNAVLVTADEAIQKYPGLRTVWNKLPTE
jgi:PIN domain nuclease of toxin-antitoxin system